MTQAARERGYEYIAITDHSKRVAMAHGFAERRLDYGFMRFGVAQARRGWLEKIDVVNTKSLSELRKAIRRG